MSAFKKIAITGPESTGKSWLSEQLANHYQGFWVPEYARAYIDQLDRPYEAIDILAIAKGQLQREEAMAMKARTANSPLFCDTELLVAKIWSDVKYGKCDSWILNQLEEPRYDLILLCDIDLPWEEDPQREHPHMRKHLFDLYHNELKERGWPFQVVKGTDRQRLDNAINAIEKSLYNES
jgi:NadR type nicotinamide-nucleotide adenylyltransferase